MHLMQRLNLQDPLASKWRFKGALMPLTSPTSLVCKPTSHNWPGPKGLMQIGRWLRSPARRPWTVINKYYKCFILKSSSQLELFLMGLKLIWGPSWSWQLALRLMVLRCLHNSYPLLSVWAKIHPQVDVQEQQEVLQLISLPNEVCLILVLRNQNCPHPPCPTRFSRL